jgi:hypothetical protein
VVAVAAVAATVTLLKSAAKTVVQAAGVNLPLTNLTSVSALAAQALTGKAFTVAGAAGGGKPLLNLVAVAAVRVAKANLQALTVRAVKVESAQKDSPIGRQLLHQATAAILLAVAVVAPTLRLVLVV